MKEILRTSSISLAESLRVALEAEGISAFVSNANLGGLPPAAITVAVADDADYDQGLVVLNELQRPTLNAPPVRRRLLRALIIAIVGVVLILCANLFLVTASCPRLAKFYLTILLNLLRSDDNGIQFFITCD